MGGDSVLTVILVSAAFSSDGQLALMDPADIAARRRRRRLAELARHQGEIAARFELLLDALRRLQRFGVLVGIVHREENFAHQVMRLVGAFGIACQFGIHLRGRDVDAVLIFRRHRLLPGDLGGELGAQRLLAGSGIVQHVAQLGDGEVIVAQHVR